jgi:hypothetical protein
MKSSEKGMSLPGTVGLILLCVVGVCLFFLLLSEVFLKKDKVTEETETKYQQAELTVSANG